MAPDPFNVPVWKLLLDKAVASGHLPGPHRDSLLLSLEGGFRIGIDPSLPVPNKVRHAPNLRGTHVNRPDYDPEVTLKILQSLKKEIQLGRTAGPFIAPPFPNFQQSPIGAVPKSHSTKLRVIHHLSYPRNESRTSVNSRLVHAPCSYLRFHSVLDTIAAIGPTCLLAKVDIKDAFRLLRVHVEDHYNLGIKFAGFYMYERCISFGIHPGPSLFEHFATAVEAVIRSKGVPHCPHYLDDSIIISTPEQAACDYATALGVFRELKIPLSEDKLAPPSPSIVFLGIEIDCPSMEMRIPEDKVIRYRKEIGSALASATHGFISVTALHSLVGILRYCTNCIHRGRLFIHHLQRALNEAFKVPSARGLRPHRSKMVDETPDFDPDLAALTFSDSPRDSIDPTPIRGRPPGNYPRTAALDTYSQCELRWWDNCLRQWNGVTLIPSPVAAPRPAPSPIVEGDPSFPPSPIVEGDPSFPPSPIVEGDPSFPPSPIVEGGPSFPPSPTVEGGPSFAPPSPAKGAGSYLLLTDACNTGMGAWLVTPNGQALYLLHAWSADELLQAHRIRRLSMPFLELLAVVFAVLTWHKELANSVVDLRSDCTGVVHALTSDYSKSPQSHQLLLSLYLITTVNRITIRFSHIPGKDNVEADALSRAASIDTHRQDSLLEGTFFPLPSVLSVPQNRLQRSLLPPYEASTIFMPSEAASNMTPWRSPHTRRTNTASAASGSSAYDANYKTRSRTRTQ
jgi:hypothetical protein